MLLALLHEVDRAEFKEELQRLQAAPIHPLHKRSVDLMAKRFDDQMFGEISDQVPIYISRDVEQPALVFSLLHVWARTRDPALQATELRRLGRYLSPPFRDRWRATRHDHWCDQPPRRGMRAYRVRSHMFEAVSATMAREVFAVFDAIIVQDRRLK